VRAGRVRMLGVTSRSEAFPDVPLISKDVPGYDADTWFALFAPGATPKEIVSRIRDDLAAVLQIPEVRQRLLDIGGTPSGEPTDEFAGRVKNEIAKWQNVAKVAGVTPQ
jgi:tripartite-type tricarboxylate transporter receptor subunit TctC